MFTDKCLFIVVVNFINQNMHKKLIIFLDTEKVILNSIPQFSFLFIKPHTPQLSIYFFAKFQSSQFPEIIFCNQLVMVEIYINSKITVQNIDLIVC